MEKPSALHITLESFALLGKEFPTLARIAWAPTLIFGLVFFMAESNPVIWQTEGISHLFADIIMVLLQVSVMVSWMRYLILGRDGLKGRHFWRYQFSDMTVLVWKSILYIFFWTVWFVVLMFLIPYAMEGLVMLGIFTGGYAGNVWMKLISMAAMAGLFLPFYARLATGYASLACDRGLMMPELWHAAQGKWPGLWAATSIVWFVGMILPEMINMSIGGFVPETAVIYVKSASFAIGEFAKMALLVTVSTLYYKALLPFIKQEPVISEANPSML